jgi:peroxiredoxin Q/BCP
MVEVGSRAPSFTLTDQRGNAVALDDLLGRHAGVVVFFYPKAMTSGCTQESCDFQARAAAFAKQGYAVVGVSPDAPARQAKFAEKEALADLLLLADEDHRVADAFGAWGEKTLYGRKYHGVLRKTFVVGKDGTVAAAWPSVKIPGHADAVLASVGGGAKAPAASPVKKKAAKKKAAEKKAKKA